MKVKGELMKVEEETSESGNLMKVKIVLLEAHNTQLIALIGGLLSRVATPLKDPNQENKYRSLSQNINIIRNCRYHPCSKQHLKLFAGIFMHCIFPAEGRRR